MNYENVVLVVHLLLSLALIGVVLLQRSEGGGLGIGGGGGAASGRPPATALGKVTWGLGIAFICTSLALTVIAANNATGVSVLDRITDVPDVSADDLLPELGGDLLPPATDDSGLVIPQADTGDLVPDAGDTGAADDGAVVVPQAD